MPSPGAVVGGATLPLIISDSHIGNLVTLSDEDDEALKVVQHRGISASLGLCGARPTAMRLRVSGSYAEVP